MFNMKMLTKRQEEILNYLRQHSDQHGYWPSIREIQSHFDFKSTNAVMGHLRALERKKAIIRVSGQARAYRIIIDPVPTQQDGNIEVVDLPIYGSIAAGYPDGVEPSGEIGRIQVDSATAGINRSRRPFALKVRGDSMFNAGIYDGDIVIVESGEPRNGQIVAALIDGETTLKRYICDPDATPYLKAENPDYPELHPLNEMMIQGLAKAVVRSL